MIPHQRDLDETNATLQAWFQQLEGVSGEVDISDFSAFDEGFSGELLAFRARWTDAAGDRDEEMVVRVEPNDEYQVFLDTNFLEQYRVIEALDRHTDVVVPKAIGFENDPTLLGERFYVMGKSPGRTGQVYLEWMQDVGEAGREKMWWNGLAAMAEMHRADWKGLGLGMLDQQNRGDDGLAQQLDYYHEYYDWGREGVSYPIVEQAYEWLAKNKPQSGPDGIVWGDARRGNQLFTDDLQCSAILDLEGVCLGPAEVDVGWWLVVEQMYATGLDIHCPGIVETIDGYGKLLGRPLENMDYYMVFASFRATVIAVKLWRLREGDPGIGDPNSVGLAEMMAKHAR